MNRPTNNIIFYTLVSFFVAILIIGGFFGYKIIFPGNQQIGEDIIIDDIFNNIFNNGFDEKKNGDKYVSYENEECLVGENSFIHGRVNRFYSRSFVGVYESCEDFSEIKKCFDGKWLGEEKFQYSVCKRSIDCKINENTIIKNGESIEMFSKNEVFFGDNCEKYKRIRECRETKLMGGEEFKYRTCVVSEHGVCDITDSNGDRKKIPNRTSRILFSKSNVNYDDSCDKYSKNRFCANSILDGDENFSFLYCKIIEPRSCFLSGVDVAHGQGRIFYSKSRAVDNKTCGFFAEIRRCEDGDLLGKEEYSKIDCSE